jgi:type II secretory ATPase GspE/PulE/Tfp pilus assembly ATPase PilB-like protein
MKTLRQDGFDKVLAGLTTLDEVLRVTTEEAAVTQE